MDFKRFLVNKLILFFTLSTLITVTVALVGSAFAPAERFGYNTMLLPIRYAALCMLPTFVTFSKRELSPRALLVRKALMLVLIEAVMMIIAFTGPEIDSDRPEVILVIAGCVLVIFVLVHLFLWLKDAAEAKKLNLELTAYQTLHT